MKKLYVVCLVFAVLAGTSLRAQDEPNAITTAVPFLIISADARASGIGEQGVATSPDSYGVQWNPAKLAFLDRQQNIGVNYSPFLSQLVNDIGIGNLVYSNRFDERMAFAFSLRYFTLGNIPFADDAGNSLGEENPNEFTLDGTYALKLSERFSMAVTGRFFRSDLRLQQIDADASAATSFAVDISGYYQSEEILYNTFDGRWRAGFNISNIGPSISYDDTDNNENFLPTNLKLGGGFDFILDTYNKVAVSLEFNKLLVPTPPLREIGDADGDGIPNEIISGQDDDVNFFSGIFQSFGDAPDGFSEELAEWTASIGVEYTYNDVFALRAGYFNESELKGARKFATLGAGFEFSSIDIDISYLFSTGQVRSPLENTLRFGVTFHFGDEYDEY